MILPRESEIEGAFMAEFTQAIETFRKASSDGHGEQAEAAALQMLSLAAQEAERILAEGEKIWRELGLPAQAAL